MESGAETNPPLLSSLLVPLSGVHAVLRDLTDHMGFDSSVLIKFLRTPPVAQTLQQAISTCA